MESAISRSRVSLDAMNESRRLEEALRFAARAVDGARVCLPAHGLLASVLLKLGRLEDARQVVARAERLPTGVADAYDSLAYVSMALGEHDRANALYRRATQIAPNEPRYWYNLACSERSLGRLTAAEVACNQGIALDATQYPTYLLRSELRVQDAQGNHIDELTALLTGPNIQYRAQIFLGYALAKELDDVGRFDEAFRWFAIAAKSRRERLAYDVATDERKLRRITKCYPFDSGTRTAGSTEPPRVASGARLSRESARYIFIVGLPRSGTTLVERILMGLPKVRSNGETDHFSRALLAASKGAGDVFERAAAADSELVEAGYAKLAGAGAGCIIEKLPFNYLYLGAIRRALPEAKIVLVNRSPLDSCFAMFRTLFVEGYPFSYDLAELGRYYTAYAQLMNH